jgi:hypothetical protein
MMLYHAMWCCATQFYFVLFYAIMTSSLRYNRVNDRMVAAASSGSDSSTQRKRYAFVHVNVGAKKEEGNLNNDVLN